MTKMEKREIILKNVLSLAYLGDSVFTVMVRDYLVSNSLLKPSTLNKKANKVVCARTQSEIMAEIAPRLQADEHDIVMRARNSHLNNKAKNSTMAEYNMATQFEALVGYWYLLGEKKKLDEMFNSYVVARLK